jgi:hypothetical protein
MLEEKELTNPNATEDYFCKPLNAFKPEVLSTLQMKMMTIIYATSEEFLEKLEADLVSVYWFYPAIQKRLDAYFTYKMDTKAKMLLASWCGSVGDVVIYLTLLQYKCKLKGIKKLDFEDLALMFSDGIISEDFKTKIWDGQKVQCENRQANLIDYPSTMKSLIF